MDNKFALLFWSEEFHYFRYVREERNEKFALLLWSEFSFGNEEIFTIRNKREEKNRVSHG